MLTEMLDPFPPNENPFHHDLYHMGTPIGTDLMVMHDATSSRAAKYIILIHRPTGRRMKITFPIEV